jgi:type I restriction enzyme S subunit
MREGWTRTTVGDVSRFRPGKYLKKEDYESGGEYFVYGSNSVMGTHTTPLYDGPLVVMAGIGAYAGACRYSEEPCWVNNNAFAICADEKVVDPRYLYLWLDHLLDLGNVRLGTGQPYIQKPALERQVIELPPLDEQRRIVDLVGAVEELARRCEARAAASDVLREGLLREFFDPSEKGWTRSVVGDIAKVVGGGTPKTSVDEYWDGDIPWITPSEVTRIDGGVATTTERSITAEGLARSAASLLPANTVLFTSRATIGAAALAGVPMATNQGFASMICNTEVLSHYLMHWVRHNKQEFIARAGGSTFLEVSKTNVSSVPIDLPPLEEQHRVVSVIASLDLADAETTATSAGSTRLRSALLSELLTGAGTIPSSYDSILGWSP